MYIYIYIYYHYYERVCSYTDGRATYTEFDTRPRGAQAKTPSHPHPISRPLKIKGSPGEQTNRYMKRKKKLQQQK